MNLIEARERYEAGDTSVRELAKEGHMCPKVLTRLFKESGVEIRPKGPAPINPLPPPAPRLCIYGCGRTATAIPSQTCLPCALHPPCRCARPIGSGAFYGGQESCRRCGNLMQKGR